MATMLSLSGRSARAVCTMRDDDELLERMKEDDTDAYRELVERHIDRAYGLALRMLKNSDAHSTTPVRLGVWRRSIPSRNAILVTGPKLSVWFISTKRITCCVITSGGRRRICSRMLDFYYRPLRPFALTRKV